MHHGRLLPILAAVLVTAGCSAPTAGPSAPALAPAATATFIPPATATAVVPVPSPLATTPVQTMAPPTAPAATSTHVPPATAPAFKLTPSVTQMPTSALPTGWPPYTPNAPPAFYGPTAGRLSREGEPLFASSCAGCHGLEGEGLSGPALIRTGSQLDKFGNAQQLLQYISATMPLSAPGSLKAEQYLQVLAFLFVGNDYVTTSSLLDANGLERMVILPCGQCHVIIEELE